jgi:hypothetical protein
MKDEGLCMSRRGLVRKDRGCGGASGSPYWRGCSGDYWRTDLGTSNWNPLKQWTKDNVVRGASKEWTFEKRRWTCPECNNGIRDRGATQQLLLRKERTLNKIFRRTVELEIRKWTVGSSIRPWKASDRILWRGWPPPKWKKRPPTVYMRELWPLSWVLPVLTCRRTWQYVCRLLGTNSLQEGAMWHICWKPRHVARQWHNKHISVTAVTSFNNEAVFSAQSNARQTLTLQ